MIKIKIYAKWFSLYVAFTDNIVLITVLTLGVPEKCPKLKYK